MPILGPFKDYLRQQVVRQTTAGTGQSTPMGIAPFAGRVTGVTLRQAATALTGDATNNRIFTLFNRGQATPPVGTTSVAVLTTTANIADNGDVSLVLSGTAANLEVAAGDRLELVETTGGTGVAHGGFMAEVEITRYS